MTKEKELALFNEQVDELIRTNYILANTKIINVLKSIAVSETMQAILKSGLEGYNYAKAKRKHLITSVYHGENRGEFILPETPQEIFTFVFCLLMDFQSNTMPLNAFLSKYFYENGSTHESYTLFINNVIRPFKKSVQILMQSAIDGNLKDPKVQEQQLMKIVRLVEDKEKARQEVVEKDFDYGVYSPENFVSRVISFLAEDKDKIKSYEKMDSTNRQEIMLIVSMFIRALKSEDKEAIKYSYLTYKYMSLYNKKLGLNLSKIEKLLKEEGVLQ